MKEFVAVDHPFVSLEPRALKKQALMFDRIAVPQLKSLLAYKGEERKEANATLRWLHDRGIVFEPALRPEAKKISHDEYRQNIDKLREHSQKLLEEMYGCSIDELIEFLARRSKARRSKRKV